MCATPVVVIGSPVNTWERRAATYYIPYLERQKLQLILASGFTNPPLLIYLNAAWTTPQYAQHLPHTVALSGSATVHI